MSELTPSRAEFLRRDFVAWLLVMVSFYERYAVALWLPQAILIAWLLSGRWKRPRTLVSSL